MRCTLVTHTHWDREWYRTHQDFRGRLVDAVDRLLELCEADPGYHFLLDGQSIVVEDYLEVRPGRRETLAALCREGRIGIGPWYVQPDSLLPSGEAHVRNLLEGRRVADALGRASRVAYTPDSFGHPAQFPQLFAGFGMQAFVYWRGHGDELLSLPAEYWWESPDGSTILACHLSRGYFNAVTGPASEPDVAARRIAGNVRDQSARAKSGRLLLMNGIDHALPEARTAELAEALEKEIGHTVVRALIEDFLDGLPAPDAVDRHRGELLGGREANLLPGVWSTRTWIKLRNRICETALEGWAEPWSALGARVGAPDERPALRTAWRTLLPNHAHDSICGCSHDAVHEQMRGRFDAAEELADATTQRMLERIAGLGPGRLSPWTDAPEIAVFNPSPRPRTDVVRFAVDPHPWMVPGEAGDPVGGMHPLALRSLDPPGFAVNGAPARVIGADDGRMVLLPDRKPLDLEFVVEDVPAFGWKRLALEPSDRVEEVEDDGREIGAGEVAVRVQEDGCFDVRFGARQFRGLGRLEDRGDRGDTYDTDLLAPDEVRVAEVDVRRFRHPSGIARLAIRRVLEVGAALAPDRERREGRARVEVVLTLRVAPGVPRVDVEVGIDNGARDHRLRLLLPTDGGGGPFETASTFDVARRTPGALPSDGWIHPAPETFPCQGWVHAGGLTAVAPGLNEAQVLDDGTIALTLLRAVGDLSRHDLRSRPGPAGPGNATPGAQCLGPLALSLSLFAGCNAAAARDAELGLRAAFAGDAPLAPEDTPLLSLSPPAVVLSAVKPAEEGNGFVVRVLNPTDEPVRATIACRVPFDRAEPVRLDETEDVEPVACEGSTVSLEIRPRGLRSVKLS